MRIAPDGRPKMVLFVAHWCPHCRREVPLISKWINSGKAPKDVEIVTVATGTKSDYPNYPPSKWLRDAKWAPPVLADSKTYTAANAFGLSEYPYFVLLRPDGKVAARTSGEIPIVDLATALQTLEKASVNSS
jgi:thiol-disulfide isomerase/thioredoxin